MLPLLVSTLLPGPFWTSVKALVRVSAVALPPFRSSGRLRQHEPRDRDQFAVDVHRALDTERELQPVGGLVSLHAAYRARSSEIGARATKKAVWQPSEAGAKRRQLPSATASERSCDVRSGRPTSRIRSGRLGAASTSTSRCWSVPFASTEADAVWVGWGFVAEDPSLRRPA